MKVYANKDDFEWFKEMHGEGKTRPMTITTFKESLDDIEISLSRPSKTSPKIEGQLQHGVNTGELKTCEDCDSIKGSPQKKNAPCKGLCPDCNERLLFSERYGYTKHKCRTSQSTSNGESRNNLGESTDCSATHLEVKRLQEDKPLGSSEETAAETPCSCASVLGAHIGNCCKKGVR